MTLTTQWVTLSLMFASGAFLGFFLDIYRVLARRFSLRGWPITLFDLLFWLAAACFVFAVLLWSNWGEMRFYIMIAIIAGILCYLRLLTRPVTRILVTLLKMIERLIKLLIRVVNVLVYRPVVRISLLLWRIVRKLALICWAILTKPIIWAINPIISYCRPYIKKWKQFWPRRKKEDDKVD